MPDSNFPWELVKANTLRSLCRDINPRAFQGKREDMIAFLKTVAEQGLAAASAAPAPAPPRRAKRLPAQPDADAVHEHNTRHRGKRARQSDPGPVRRIRGPRRSAQVSGAAPARRKAVFDGVVVPTLVRKGSVYDGDDDADGSEIDAMLVDDPNFAGEGEHAGGEHAGGEHAGGEIADNGIAVEDELAGNGGMGKSELASNGSAVKDELVGGNSVAEGEYAEGGSLGGSELLDDGNAGEDELAEGVDADEDELADDVDTGDGFREGSDKENESLFGGPTPVFQNQDLRSTHFGNGAAVEFEQDNENTAYYQQGPEFEHGNENATYHQPGPEPPLIDDGAGPLLQIAPQSEDV